MKTRLDQVLVERGLASTRSQARDLVRRGAVKVAGSLVTKPGASVAEAADVAVTAGAQPWASRGGLKLAAALEAFAFDPRDRVTLDVGASTGGFTDVLLTGGARSVIAVDVGRGQFAPHLASDPRVTVLEGTDARALDATLVPEPPSAVVADLSFTSVTKVLAPALALAASGAWAVILVKPQFELQPADIGKGGLVRDEASRLRAVESVRTWVAAQPGWRILGVVPSPIEGGSGNLEMLLGAVRE